MKRLSSYLFRVAGLSAFVAAAVMMAIFMGGEALRWKLFELSVPPAILAELNDDSGREISQQAIQTIQTYYQYNPYILPLISLVIGVIVGGLIGLIHARRLTVPLDAVAAAAGRLAQGDTTARADAMPVGIADIDDFTRNFNSMAAAIARSERALRESNAAIAHELRTPLTVLTGRINGMIDGVFPMDEAALQTLLVQTGQLNRLIDDLKILTLAEAGQFSLHPEPIDLGDIAAAAAANETDLTVGLSAAPVSADPARIRQILDALLTNARRYGGSGLRIETGQADGAAFLRVLDRGPGLPAASQAEAFTAFWRAEPSRGREAGGSGLGLAVVQALARTHGGRVSYDARDGGGAIFTVYLPMRLADTV